MKLLANRVLYRSGRAGRQPFALDGIAPRLSPLSYVAEGAF